MNDAELLQAAGKACGFRLDADGDRLDQRAPGGAPLLWRPFEDDGDAFRLCVALQITHQKSGDAIHAHVFYRDEILGDVIKVLAPVIDGDECSAARRAVVLAAAELAGAIGLLRPG